MATQTIKIDIVSDTVCPWYAFCPNIYAEFALISNVFCYVRCFIGKRRLEKAMQQFKATNPSVTFDVEWHPFQLNPTMSKENPIPKLVNYRRKFGEERTNEFIPYMKGIGQAEGIQFAFDGLTSNTLDSHRLIHWAKQFGKQNELVEELFKDYFERDRNIGDNQVLAEAAGRVGLDQAQVS